VFFFLEVVALIVRFLFLLNPTLMVNLVHGFFRFRVWDHMKMNYFPIYCVLSTTIETFMTENFKSFN
jgi:hypothetical protein